MAVVDMRVFVDGVQLGDSKILPPKLVERIQIASGFTANTAAARRNAVNWFLDQIPPAMIPILRKKTLDDIDAADQTARTTKLTAAAAAFDADIAG